MYAEAHTRPPGFCSYIARMHIEKVDSSFDTIESYHERSSKTEISQGFVRVCN